MSRFLRCICLFDCASRTLLTLQLFTTCKFELQFTITGDWKRSNAGSQWKGACSL